MKQVMVVPSFHCDVVWRRTPGEQTAIRAAQFSSALNMLAKCPEFRFEFDQAAIVREYLAAHPARLKAMRRFIREGRLDITGGEETIPDTNMVTGEGLVRNFFLGRLWFEETLGVRPVVANLDDAFGLNPQLPQVFRLFGYRYFREAHTPGLDLKLARRGILWEGLDGSRIFYAPAHGHIQLGTHVCNLPIVYAPMERARVSLAETISVDLPVVYCTYSSEEGLVEDRVVDLVLNWPARRGERIRFALAREALVALRRACPRPPVVRGEFNPSQPGTYITRISLKQAYRRAEWDTIVAESAAACVALAGSAGRRGQLTGMWRKLAYVQFHDSLCGCHTAPVNRRVMDYCRQVSRTAQRLGTEAVRRLHARGGRAPGLVVFNPLPFARREPLEIALPKSMVPSDANGNPVAAERWGRMALAVVDLAPLGTTAYPLVRTGAARAVTASGERAAGRCWEVGPYAVTARHTGVTIVQRRWRHTLVSGNFPQIRFRFEDGTLWDENFLGSTYTDEAGTRRLIVCETGPVTTRFVWRGEVHGDPAADPPPLEWRQNRTGRTIVYADLKRLAWEKELIFYRALDRIDVRIRLDFRGRNTEVLVGFPLRIDLHTARALYEVPFGVAERRPYFEVPSDSPEREQAPFPLAALGGKGAWPALGWVAYQDARWGMALANRGTPSHRLMNGMIEVGVLRSPMRIGSGFNVPRSALENGRHTYAFALLPHLRRTALGTLSRFGAGFNAVPIVRPGRVTAAAPETRSWLELKAPGVTFSAWKRAERGNGYVLRTYETEGKEATGSMRTAFLLARVVELDLMERPVRTAHPDRLHWRPFEIKTLLLEPTDAVSGQTRRRKKIGTGT